MLRGIRKVSRIAGQKQCGIPVYSLSGKKGGSDRGQVSSIMPGRSKESGNQPYPAFYKLIADSSGLKNPGQA